MNRINTIQILAIIILSILVYNIYQITGRTTDSILKINDSHSEDIKFLKSKLSIEDKCEYDALKEYPFTLIFVKWAVKSLSYEEQIKENEIEQVKQDSYNLLRDKYRKSCIYMYSGKAKFITNNNK